MQNRKPLTRLLDQHNLYAMLFNNLDVVYMDETLYRDPSMVGGSERLLGYLHASPQLVATLSEK